METREITPGDVVRIAEDQAVRSGVIKAVRSRIDTGRLQTPKAIETYRLGAHSKIDSVSELRGYSPERATELRGFVDQGIAEGLNPTLPATQLGEL